MKKDKNFTTKDSGKRQVFKTGMQRDAGEKTLYREVYYPLDKTLHSDEAMLEYWRENLLFSVKEVCNGTEPREYLTSIISLVHKMGQSFPYLMGL